MVRLVLLGLAAGLLFSSTFILNRKLGIEGGHWAWTASLRYGYIVLLLTFWIWLRHGLPAVRAVAKTFRDHWKFWVIAGTIGYGFFYSTLSFAAVYAPGWVVASTWTLTILATPVVLYCFGRKVPIRGVFIASLVFLGVVLVNAEQAGIVSVRSVLLGALPTVVAAFSYPLGNQMLKEAKEGGKGRIPHIQDPIMGNAPAMVLLLTLGSIPFWGLVVAITDPGLPTVGQLVNVGLVALFAGVAGTSIFLYARHLAKGPYQTAAVDTTQASSIPWAVVGEIVLLGGTPPHLAGTLGVVLILGGLASYAVYSSDL